MSHPDTTLGQFDLSNGICGRPMSNDGGQQIQQVDGSRTSQLATSEVQADGNSVFYGVFIPADAVEQEINEQNYSTTATANGATGGEPQLVFTDKDEALKMVKKYRSARFKCFKSRGEAIEFSKIPVATLFITSTPMISNDVPLCSDVKSSTPVAENNSLERGTSFRGPKSQELVKLRKAIESGDEEFFLQTVWANPRYLISSGDTPTILQEGPRYNALHVAAKSKQSVMCQYVMETIENVKFMQLLYNDDSPSTRLRRINFLVDLYINMPDNPLGETPLHFAAKFGCVKIVEILASHPACVKSVENKYNQTPKDVICTRYSSSCSELRRQIEEALEDQFFVPVLGAEDNSCQPFVGEPRSAGKRLAPEADANHDSTPFVRAYAGPMSPKIAEEFRHRWKTSPAARGAGRKRFMAIRLSDTDKGLERIGRDLARESNIPWVEHWSFLDTYCDLTKPDGLSKLETFLRNKYNEMSSAQAKRDVTSQDISVIDQSPSAVEATYGSSAFDENDISRSDASTSSDQSVGSLCERFSTMAIRSPDQSQSKYSQSCPTVFRMSRKHGVLSKNKNAEKQDLEAKDAAAAAGDAEVEHENDHETSPKLASGHRAQIFMDHVCREIASKVAHEVYEHAGGDDRRLFASLGFRPSLNRSFLDEMTPSIECLIRFAMHPSKTHDSSLQPHVAIARHVVHQLREELSEEIISASVRNITSNEDPLASVSSSDEESCEYDGNRYRGCTALASSAVSQTVVWQHFKCIFSVILSMIANDEDADQSQQSISCECDWAGGQSLTSTPSFKASNLISEQRDSNVLSDEGSSTDTSYHTPPSSIISSQRSSLSDAKTPNEGLFVFINGAEPTKLDVDVLRALDGCSVDPIVYPHIYRWRFLVTSYSKEEIEKWPTPMSLRKRSIGFISQDRRASLMSTPNSTSSVQQPHQLYADSDQFVPANLYKIVLQNLATE